MPMSPQDAAEAKAAGWSDAEIAGAIPIQRQQISNPQAIAATLKGNAGGIAGGGIGGIGGGALAGTLVEPGLGTLAGGIIGALAGSYGGQRAQNAIQSDATNQAQMLAMAQAQQEHPITSAVTDIAASSLAGGGKPSIKGLKSLLTGSLENGGREALQQAAINPAIQTGVSLASGNGIPSVGDLAESAIGGSLFSKNWLPSHGVVEPNEEVNNSGEQKNVDVKEVVPQEAPLINESTTYSGINKAQPTANASSPVDAFIRNTPPTYPIFQQEVLQKIIDKGATKPVSVQRIFPNLKLTFNEASEALRQADLLSELHTERPTTEQESEQPNATTGIREDTQQTSSTGETSKRSQVNSGSNMVETTPDGGESFPPKISGGIPEETKQPVEVPKVTTEQITAAKWNRKELERRNAGKVTTETAFPPGGSIFQNAIDKVRKISFSVADAYHKFFNERQLFHGQVYGAVKDLIAKTGFTDADSKQLSKAMMYEERNNVSIPSSFLKNNAQRAVWAKYKQVYREQGQGRLEDKQPVIDAGSGQPRLPVLNEHSHPVMINPKVVDTLRNNTDMVKVNRLKDDFIKDQLSRGVDDEKAQKNLDTILSAVQGKPISRGQTGNLNYFNANRRAQGIPLPESWSRHDFEQNLKAFSYRNAADRAHFRNIEKNGSVMRQLNETHDAWGMPIEHKNEPVISGNKDVHALVNSAHGDMLNPGEQIEKGLSSAITASFIASPALSGIHIPIANIVGTLGLADNPIIMGKMIVNAIKGVTDGITTARKNGLKVDAGKASVMFDANLSSAERLHGVANLIRKISTFNELATKGTIGFTQAAMETLVPSKLLKANDGNRTAQQWLRHLDPEYYVGKKYTKEQMGQLASFAVNTIHGSSDARTLPSWMLHDNELSGFMSLAHWSISQTDRFMKDIYTPATNGDIKPLLTTMFGAAIGGYIIKKLREDISGKKSQIPSLSEIANSSGGLQGNVPLVAYNMIAALQYSGFAGMFTQIAKYPFDAIYKNSPQGATFPLDETVTDIAHTVEQTTSAIANDPNINWVDLAQAVSTHLLTNSFRLGREAYNQAINNGMVEGLPAEKKELSDKMGQLRRFDMVEGLPYNEIDQGGNPYMNIEQKKFKMNQNVGEAVQQIPELVKNIITNYADKPDVMLQKFKSLKINDYSVFPSMENTPISFMKYLSFLNKEEGSDAASKTLQDYLMHRAINEAKASAVP